MLSWLLLFEQLLWQIELNNKIWNCEPYFWLCEEEMFWREPPFWLLPATVLHWTDGGVPGKDEFSFFCLLFLCWLDVRKVWLLCVGRKAGGLSSPDSWVSLRSAWKSSVCWSPLPRYLTASSRTALSSVSGRLSMLTFSATWNERKTNQY